MPKSPRIGERQGQQACRQGYRALYRRLPPLFEELTLAHADGSYATLLARLARVDVLVLDDCGLAALKDGHRHDLLEMLDESGRQSLDRHHEPTPARALARLPRRPDRR